MHLENVRDLIYWRFAGLVAASASSGEERRSLLHCTFQALKSGRLSWHTAISGWLRQKSEQSCVYCGSRSLLSALPTLPGYSKLHNSPANITLVCSECKSIGASRLMELVNSSEANPVVEANCLRLLYRLHETKGTLHLSLEKLKGKICLECSRMREAEGLSVY